MSAIKTSCPHQVESSRSLYLSACFHKTELQLSFGGRDIFRPQRRDLAGRVHHAIAIGTCRSESVRGGDVRVSMTSLRLLQAKAIGACKSHRCLQWVRVSPGFRLRLGAPGPGSIMAWELTPRQHGMYTRTGVPILSLKHSQIPLVKGKCTERYQG